MQLLVLTDTYFRLATNQNSIDYTNINKHVNLLSKSKYVCNLLRIRFKFCSP
jgi:hypothetical protein